jgi:predicted house-cleaning NTP pyrophosphatase (Maf/HAM1 superfamily)
MVEIVASLMEGSSHRDVVLASEAESRQKLLTAAGLAFRIVPPDVDEAAIHEALYSGKAETDPSDVAELLARTKAEEVSTRFPGALVIGADQVLSLDGKVLDKPTDRDAVRDSLLALRGKTHQLHSAVALAEGGAHHLDPHRHGSSDNAGVLAGVPGSVPCCRRSASLPVSRPLSARRAWHTAFRSH